MRKKFNITGRSFPAQHYMADVSEKMKQVVELIEDGEYFIINRPRQYGKTTTLFTIDKLLRDTGDYLVFNTSFGGIGDVVFDNESSLSQVFIELLSELSVRNAPHLTDWLYAESQKHQTLKSLSQIITELANKTEKKIVVMIDEVDKSTNNQLFVSFLAMLRDKYLAREEDKTFYSVVLAGVHDIKSLKLKLRRDVEKKLNSPWNIAADFKVDMNLHPHEIKPMLDEYAADKGVKIDAQDIADRLFYYTSGYPFLVSKLCKMLDEDIEPTKTTKEWTVKEVDKAAKVLISNDSNANFDSLIKNLLDNDELYQFVYSIIIDGRKFDYTLDNPLVNLGTIYGIFMQGVDGKVAIHNRIYRERVANMMISKLQTDAAVYAKYDMEGYNYRDQFVRPNNSLDVRLILLKFQAFMKEQYNKKERTFLERHGRLVFLAFLKPIINGGGYDFKEPQISQEKRLDVVITYYEFKYVAELKIWRGDIAHEKGLIQLADYLEKEDLDEGFLLIFDHSSVKTWASDWVEKNGKRIFVVWV